jgi:hypothetical protein
LLSWDEALTAEALVRLEALIEDVLIWETLIIHVAFSSSSHTNCCGCQEVDGLVYIIIISLRAIAKFLVPLYLLTAFVTYWGIKAPNKLFICTNEFTWPCNLPTP